MKRRMVSVVTPVYNGEKYLPRFLDSVLIQTYAQLEMILVDDGSSDNTLYMARRYRKAFAERGWDYHIVEAEHKNASAAINRGLDFVTGEYLIWPDSDDVLEADSIEKRVEFLEAHPEYQCVRSLPYYIEEETGMRADCMGERTGDLQKENLFWDVLEAETFVSCGCYLLRSQAFFEIYPKRRIPESDAGQNFQMLLPFLYRHKCATIQERLYGVYIRNDSHSRRKKSSEEKEKNCRDFEALLSRIMPLCPIQDRVSRRRIARWKARRRYELSRGGPKWKQFFALCRLAWYGRRGLCRFWK
ncbi:MAG: glycosyltransferase family 2 protein [Acetatifactor sp.]|nr:glycosyltransferase family 2 protein [Acetatifactor sp.]